MTERWLVVGAGGQLGTDLMRVLDGQYVIGLTRHELDITDVDAVARAVAAVVPSVIVNAAAYTAVDAAETDEATAFTANATAPAALAAAAAKAGAKFVHVSTDYVFAGDATMPYDEAAATGPKSAYGRTKLAGEQAVFAELPDAYVVRTAWVYGASGANFVKTMARLERERETVSVVDDQRGSPTWSRDLARGLVDLGSSDAAGGVYHCTNTGETTWFGFTRAIFEELGADPERVLPTTTAAFPRPAPRPAYSVLGNRRWIEAGLDPLPHWRAALHDAFASAPDELRGSAR
ncbi:MAG TPA: dTDP-4-dehydrorhamnose reductase [Acidothermaceae bacterium]|nr:dTDP-4-dehydrorhamnose reductase [Acidothermaceae bacterium]